MASKKKRPPTLVTKDPAKEKEKAICLNVAEPMSNELERYKQRSRELKTEIEDMNDEFRAKEVEYKDVREYLEDKLAKLKKKKEMLREQLEKEQAETENVKAKTSLLRQEIQEQERRREERKAEQKQELEQLNQLLSSKKTEVQEEMDILKKQHEAALQKLEMEERMLIQRKQEEFDRLQEQKIAAIAQERAQCKEETDKVDFLQRKMVRLIRGKRHFQSKVDELCPKVDKLKVTLDKHKQGLLNLEKEKEKLVKRCQRQKAKHEEMVRKAASKALTQKQAPAPPECRSKLTDTSQLEARVQREKSRIKELEGNLKKAASMLTTVVSNPEMENKDQLMLKVLEILESPGPQEAGSADETSGGLKPQASGTEATAETENLKRKALFLMAQYRTGDLGLVPRPTWNPKPTGARHHTLRLPPTRENLWRKALDEYRKL